MPLELYHLHLSQSERIVWLLEEMCIPYELTVFDRDPITALSPPELKALHPAGTSPYLRDTDVSPPVCLSESTAIAVYLLEVYGKAATTRLNRSPGDPDYATYLQWFQFANGSLQALMLRQMSLVVAAVKESKAEDKTDPNESASVRQGRSQLEAQLRLVDDHLKQDSNIWFAGPMFSAADCMMAFSLTTMRGFMPVDLTPYPNILRWLRNIAARPAYRRALDKADSGMEPMTEPTVRRFTEFKGLQDVLGRS